MASSASYFPNGSGKLECQIKHRYQNFYGN